MVKLFISDLTTTYPEYLETHPYLTEEVDSVRIKACMLPLFTDHQEWISTENEKFFQQRCELLPDVDFQPLWEMASEKTKVSIWKYVKMLSIMILTPDAADMAKLLENMMKDDCKPMLGEFMNGKIAAMAKEIAEQNGDNMDMLSNPAKMMDMMKNVGGHIENTIKSGKVKESELIEEAADLMEHMESNPNMKQYMNMLPPGMNMSGMKQKLNVQLKRVKEKERLQEVLKARHAAAAAAAPAAAAPAAAAAAAPAAAAGLKKKKKKNKNPPKE